MEPWYNFYWKIDQKKNFDKYIEFYKKIGMPTTLKEMHLDQVEYDDLIKVGKQATMEVRQSIRCRLRFRLQMLHKPL